MESKVLGYYLGYKGKGNRALGFIYGVSQVDDITIQFPLFHKKPLKLETLKEEI